MGLKRFRFRYADTLLFFGLDSVQNIRDFVAGFERAVVVTGRSSARISGALGDVERILKSLGVQYSVFSNVTPNPWASQAEELAREIWAMGAEVVIAIGGGSPIDTAKIGLTIAANGGRVVDYVTGARRAKRTMPLVAVNLTHGTGTEVDRYAVTTLDESREKHGLSVKYPDISVDDPKYTLTLDERQTLYTSLDAFYHAYESATSKNSNMLVEMLAEETVRIIAEVLPRLVGDLRNIELRYKMMYASMIAGIAIDMASTHAVHGIEHAISGLEPRIAHGCGLAMLGPRAAYYIHKASPEQSARLLRHINPGIKPSPEYAEEASRTIARFQEEVGFREKLSDYGLEEKDFKTIVTYALKRLGYLFNATPFTVTEDMVLDILRHAA